jgi:hypothetical protein
MKGKKEKRKDERMKGRKERRKEGKTKRRKEERKEEVYIERKRERWFSEGSRPYGKEVKEGREGRK